MKMNKIVILMLASVVLLTSYGANMSLYASDDDGDITDKCGWGSSKKFSSYLIDVNLYTGGGDVLHKKYTGELQCLVMVMIEQQDLPLVKQTTGFYHDRLAGNSRYYIGFDVTAEYDSSLDYGRFCTRLIRENVSGIAEEAAGLEKVFSERDVAGMVVTFRWIRENSEGSVTIWMKKEDLRLFNNDKITASELYQRSTITNTSGKVILLPI